MPTIYVSQFKENFKSINKGKTKYDENEFIRDNIRYAPKGTIIIDDTITVNGKHPVFSPENASEWGERYPVSSKEEESRKNSKKKKLNEGMYFYYSF